MLLVTWSAFLPWFGEQSSAADRPPVWALTPRSALPYGKVQIRTFLFKCIMGTHIPLLCTYQTLPLRLYGPLNIQVTVGIPWVPAVFNLWESELVFCILTVLLKKTFTLISLLYAASQWENSTHVASIGIDGNGVLPFIISATMVMNSSVSSGWCLF